MLIPPTLPHDFSESCFSAVSKCMLVFLLLLLKESQTPFSKAWDCTEIAQCIRMVQGAGALEKVSQRKNNILYIFKALVGPEGGCRQGMSLIFHCSIRGLFRDSHDLPKRPNNSPGCRHQPQNFDSPQRAGKQTSPFPTLKGRAQRLESVMAFILLKTTLKQA